MAGISIREFARRDGCSDKVVRRALERGHLSADTDKLLDPAMVGTGWRKRNADKIAKGADTTADTSPVRTQVSAPDDIDDAVADVLAAIAASDPPISKAEAERRKEVALAELREIDVDLQRERVVPVDEIAAMVVGEYAKVRTRLIGIPAKVAARAAVMKSAAEIQAMVAAEINQALEELSLDAGGGSPADASGTIRARAFPVQRPVARRAS